VSDHDVPPSDRLRLQRAVTDAEAISGLSFTVVFCVGSGDLHDQAEVEFVRLGLADRPAVMLLVEPVAGRFVIELGGRGTARLSPDDCGRATAAMDDCYAETGDIADCVERGLGLLCEATGAPDGLPSPAAVPNVLLTSPD
jgi:hypothetical protein